MRGKIYVRHGVASVPASEEMIRDMIRQSDGITYDKARSTNQELTFQYADKYFEDRQIGFSHENKISLGLIDADGYYTNAAFLISDQCEHSIKCAVFEDESKMHFKARKEFTGSILKQLEDAYEFIGLLNDVHVDFAGLYRVESPDYPEYAIREALLNSIIHRDYNYSGSIIINVYTDRMEFVSIGGLAKGITKKDITMGISQPRNTIVANLFYSLKLVEAYGTGIPRIMESYKDTEEPEFRITETAFVTVLPNMHVKKEKTWMVRESNTAEDRVMDLFSDRYYITRRDVEELLNCSSFPARKTLNKLLDTNRITVLGAGKATKYYKC